MPSVQMYIQDHPEFAFTGNYFTDNTGGNKPVTRYYFEILKKGQPTEAFSEMMKGDSVVFVSPGGVAEEMQLVNETESHVVFASET